MKEVTGQVFSIARDNPPVPGCTVSKAIHSGDNSTIYFSLAADTDISAEIFPYHKLILVNDGTLEVYGFQARSQLEPVISQAPDAEGTHEVNASSVHGATVPTKDAEGEFKSAATTRTLTAGQSILTPTDTPVGMRTDTGAIYTEIEIRRTDIMNSAIHAGEVFELAQLVPYQEGKIVNMDVVHNDKMKFVIMAFDAGTGLSEHAAPGEALIFALDGEGIIGYEGQEYPIQAGENFHFAKGGLHYVKAEKNFKMALFLTLE
jgi:quercetin dioxygenase-like cupin family protein